MLSKKLMLIFAVLAVFLVSVSFAGASDLNDTEVSDLDDLAIQINQTSDGQIIALESDYQSKDSTTDYIVIDKSITIDGNDHTIDAGGAERVFWVKADNVCIRNINFINAKSSSLAGGAISWWGSNGTLENCSFSNNSAVSAGGAVLWKGDYGCISNCSFSNNEVRFGPAATLTDGGGFDSSQMHIQTVNSEGGALYITGNNLSINNCSFTGNTALLNGGAVSVSGSSNVSISNSRFKNNAARYNGGAIEWNGNNALLTNSTFEGNLPNSLFLNTDALIVNSTFDKKSSIESWHDVSYVNVLFDEIGTFEELTLKVNMTPEGSVLVLDKDYEYVNGSNKGILISKSITIDGAGHTINGNRLSRMFNVTSDNVTIKNVKFVCGNAFGRYGGIAGGGAIYWSGANGLVENCSFTNNTGSGIEDDPYDKEEIIVDENGMVIHVIRFRPMGAKINEGGAIVWNGTNGTVSKCIFTGNCVGYPNSGGAICWRGDSGTVIDSEFYQNDGWCGSSIAWIGDNGTIRSSIVANTSFFNGIYWFGNNGLIRDSILLGNDMRTALGPDEANVDADYNFWGDTLNNPNSESKIKSVTKWLVMNFTHNGELVKKDQKVVIKWDITNLVNKKGGISKYYALIDKSGQLTYTAVKDGYLDIRFINGNVKVNIDTKDKITSKDLKKYYTSKTTYKVSVKDFKGKVIGKYVKFTIKGKSYNVKTDKNGVATLKVSLKPGTYKVNVAYGTAKAKNKITVKTTLITKNLSKKAKKSAKFTVKVLNSKGNAFAKKVVKIKFKGKTYKIKTNKKGIAAFKVPNNLKIGKYAIKTTCNGLTNTNRIIVRK